MRVSTLLLASTLLTGSAACLGSTEPPPIEIAIEASQPSAVTGEAIQFIVTARGAGLLGIGIDYGDGETELYGTAGARTARVTFGYAYTTAGTYQVRARATDAAGGDKEAALEFVVAQAVVE